MLASSLQQLTYVPVVLNGFDFIDAIARYLRGNHPRILLVCGPVSLGSGFRTRVFGGVFKFLCMLHGFIAVQL
eukprot:4412674-Amphidinium_carterae.1